MLLLLSPRRARGRERPATTAVCAYPYKRERYIIYWRWNPSPVSQRNSMERQWGRQQVNKTLVVLQYEVQHKNTWGWGTKFLVISCGWSGLRWASAIIPNLDCVIQRIPRDTRYHPRSHRRRDTTTPSRSRRTSSLVTVCPIGKVTLAVATGSHSTKRAGERKRAGEE